MIRKINQMHENGGKEWTINDKNDDNIMILR